MPPRSRSKAFRKAVLWTWWLPLLAAVAAAGWWYQYENRLQDEFIAVGKIVVVLPGGEVPDEATVQAHIALLESSTIAEMATLRTRVLHPELPPPETDLDMIVTSGKGGLLNVCVTGTAERGSQEFLNEAMASYIDTVEHVRRNPSPAGEKLNPRAVPMIVELAGPAIAKRREEVLPAGLFAVAGVVAGFFLMLLISGLWAVFRPANTQPSVEEIAKAAAGMDDVSHSALVEWLKVRVGSGVSGDHAS